VRSYRQKLKPLLRFLGDAEVNEITTHDLRRYVASLWDCDTLYADHPVRKKRKGELSPFTIAGRVRTAKQLFNFLQEEGVIASNPMKRIQIPNPKRRKPKAIKQPDFLVLLETTNEGTVIDLRDRAILYFLRDTGCRVGGLCGLKVKHVDFEKRLALVTEKGNKSRLVPFTAKTAEVLRSWLEVRPENKGPWLFVGLKSHANNCITQNAVAKMLDTRAKQAGCEGPTNAHAFRHAFARDFLLSGGDLGTLADLLGHEDIRTTKEYYGIFLIEELQEKHRRHSPIAQMLGGDDNE
jgi:site-specific recombinase XerD